MQRAGHTHPGAPPPKGQESKAKVWEGQGQEEEVRVDSTVAACPCMAYGSAPRSDASPRGLAWCWSKAMLKPMTSNQAHDSSPCHFGRVCGPPLQFQRQDQRLVECVQQGLRSPLAEANPRHHFTHVKVDQHPVHGRLLLLSQS